MSDSNRVGADDIRAGSRVLSLFANPLHALILRAHVDGPLRLAEVHERIGWAAHTTLRAAITNLCKFGALARQEAGAGRRISVATELTPTGEEMLVVAEVVERWLTFAPGGPIAPDSDAARGAVKALTSGWSSTLMRALANRSFTLTELDRLIPGISYPSLERRVASMRATGLIEPVQAEGRGTPYVVTDWLRRSIAPLCVAGRCERRRLGDQTAPVTNIETEAAFMLAIPLVPLPARANGTCMLAVRTEAGETDDRGRHLSGVTVEVGRGEILSCAARVEQAPPTWALGSAKTWFDVVIDGNLENLRFGGARPQLALNLAAGLHLALFNLID
jgi:DNA-binding HxlR family transcriptional regulator